MSEKLPLFPLGTVLYPGLLLPLHIFEDRYRQLVRDLRGGPQPARFGVIAIRKGRETGVGGVASLHEIGCTATVRQVTEHDDGRFDLVTVGSERFRLLGLDESGSYLRGQVQILAEETGDEATAARRAEGVRRAFRAYLEALAARGAARMTIRELPAEPVTLSYLVAASMIIELPDGQRLLAESDAVSRLGAELAMLARETTLLRSLGSAPAPELRSSPYSSN